MSAAFFFTTVDDPVDVFVGKVVFVTGCLDDVSDFVSVNKRTTGTTLFEVAFTCYGLEVDPPDVTPIGVNTASMKSFSWSPSVSAVSPSAIRIPRAKKRICEDSKF